MVRSLSMCSSKHVMDSLYVMCSVSALLVFAKGVDRIRLPAEYVITEVSYCIEREHYAQMNAVIKAHGRLRLIRKKQLVKRL